MDITCRDQSHTTIYHLMTQAIIPRPIAWVLTQHPNQSYNLAPFSYFAPVSSQPPLVVFSAGQKPAGEVKDTVANFERTGKCVIHIAHVALASQVNESSKTLPINESEVELCKLELVEFAHFSVPRLKACKVALGCTLQKIELLGDVPQRLVIAEVHQMYIEDGCLTRDEKGRTTIDAGLFDPLARLGAGDYAALGQLLHIPRPD